MAKKNIKPANPAPVVLQPLFDFPLKTKYILLCVLVLVFYGNTLMNGYALDDTGVILGNHYVQNGVSGISDIMKHDAFASYLEQLGATQSFTGGRYRPLSIVFFAIEHSLFGDNPMLMHFINVLFFISTVCAIFYFLSNFLLKKLPRGEDCAFLATILFAIHPLHTEVVANIKSLDEILSLLFIVLTFIFSLEYQKRNDIKFLFFGIVSFFLALLSKEYGLMLLVLLPILFFLHPSGKKSGSPIPVMLGAYFVTYIIYIGLRISVVGVPHSNAGIIYINNHLRMDPYYLASPVQKFATECYALGKYLYMLIVPYPLACDYSYNQIPYKNFADITVWLSIAAYLGIFYWGCKLLFKRDVMALPFFFFLFMLFPICNFVINVGAVFCERFDYHASLGFAIVISWLAIKLTRKVSFSMRRTAITGVMTVLILICAVETIGRNSDWKNDNTLFGHDVNVVPNSEFADCNAAMGYINLSMSSENASRKTHMLDTAVMLCRRAIDLDKSFPDPFINAGIAYYFLSNLDSAKYYFDILQAGLYPNHPKVRVFQPMLAKSFLLKARIVGANNPYLGLQEIKKGISEDTSNAELWYNLGGVYFLLHRYDSAQIAWKRTLQLNPTDSIARNARNGLSNLVTVPNSSSGK